MRWGRQISWKLHNPPTSESFLAGAENLGIPSTMQEGNAEWEYCYLSSPLIRLAFRTIGGLRPAYAFPPSKGKHLAAMSR